MLKKKLLMSTLLAVLSTASLAAAPGFYVGGQLGWSSSDAEYHNETSLPLQAGSSDKSGLGGRLSAGYQFDKNWAAELGYTRYADVKAKNITLGNDSLRDASLQHDAIDLVGKGILPLDNGFNVFAKLGLSYVKVNTENNFFAPHKSGGKVIIEQHGDSGSRWRPTYGLGVGYDFNENVTADISWVRVQKGNGIANLDLMSAGISYHFG